MVDMICASAWWAAIPPNYMLFTRATFTDILGKLLPQLLHEQLISAACTVKTSKVTSHLQGP